MAKKLKPIHPGEHLREDFVKPLGLSSNALARALEVTPARINEILRERRGITADTALRLARFFGTDAQSWLNLQTHYDIQCAEDEAGRAIGRIQPMRGLRETPRTPDISLKFGSARSRCGQVNRAELQTGPPAVME